MTASERNAWMVLGVAGLAVAAYAISLGVWGPGIKSTASLYLIVLAGLLPLFQMRKRPTVECDERDGEIGKKATLAAFGAVWVLMFMLPTVLAGARGWNTLLAVPVWALYQTQMWMVIAAAAAWAVATLVLYRRAH